MTKRPQYFDRVQIKSAHRWDQLESDQELAGPWHQLFRQVQSPRHVLSELLQNADDAGATEASVYIKDGVFIFAHNGEDFSEEHFSSLCRFGFSNKKSLHTIGFRGIGFKSIFSLGDRVEVLTPTLSVAFYRKRFTEPLWIAASDSVIGRTEVRVPIIDQHRQKEIQKNLSDWLKSPTSLLFFRHIRRIRIEEAEICWKAMGPGPVPNSEWMALTDKSDQRFLLVRSALEAFTEEALLEIKQERAFNLDDNAEFPPCQVEIVLGAKGRLFVVLPTGVETALPFACNAPFIQDPARLKIKDPEISPTNRWLLERAGKLTAAVMLQWLNRTDIDPAERCQAYAILPNAARDDNSIEGACETIIEQSFKAEIETAAYLLTDEGELTSAKQSIVWPKVIFEIWSAEDATKLLDSSGRSPLSRYIANSDLKKLVSWGVVDKIEKADVLRIIQNTRPPKPDTWQQLLILWAYLTPELNGYAYHKIKEQVQILPVHGKEVLYAAKDVVRLAEKRLLQSDEDWDFLSKHLLVLNQNWLRYLSEQKRTAEEQEQNAIGEKVEASYSVLNTIGFKEASDVSKVCERVSSVFFRQEHVALSDCVHLAQIAAKLGATTGDTFRFVTDDCKIRSAKQTILFDADGGLESLLPALWCDSHLLHPDYSRSFFACNKEEWERWISSGKAGLFTFVPLSQKRKDIRGRQKIEREVRLRGCSGNVSYPFTPINFFVEDWNFEDSHWGYWESLSQQNNTLWGQVVERILAQPETFWQKCKSARALQIATTGNSRAITHEDLLPLWILKLRELPCLPDTRGFYHKPADLLRRTPETESLMDVEPFIHGRLDNEAVRPLLKLLGVRSTPTGPTRLLDCLRALTRADTPPVYEVEKWYRRLDHMIDSCPTDDAKKIKQAFSEEKLILTDNNRWEQAAGVFLLSNEEDVPEAEIIRPSVGELALWRKVGVAERPTANLAIQWLKGLPSNQALPQEETNRIRALLTRHALLIWKECEHWLNLAGEWTPIETLEYALTLQSLVPWKHLHEWVKKKTADFQRLPVQISDAYPFSALPALSAQIEDRFHIAPHFQGRAERKPWLNKLGAELCRISLDTDDETQRIRALAARLEETVWQTAPGLELIPYINGVPGGTPRQAEATWLDKVLYVEQRPLPKLARNVAQELGHSFRRQDIGDAIKLCFERPPQFVVEYMEENFKLLPRQEIELLLSKAISGADTVDEHDQTSLTETKVGDTSTVAEHKEEEPKIKDIILDQEQEPGHDASGTEDLEADSVDAQEEVELVTRRHAKQARPSLIERFAESIGYKKIGEDRFSRPDGSWIGKANGSNRFPWELRSAAGEIIRYFWPKEHCLEHEALQLEADAWGLIDKFPEMYALVLSNPQDSPVELTGQHIRDMRDKGKLTLYPASYRIVYKSEE